MHRIIFALLLIISACAEKDLCSGVYALEGGYWYERNMKAAKTEPLCPTESMEKEKYRFVWLRASHNPIVITLVKDGGSVEITGARLDGTGGGLPGNITEYRTNLLSQEDFDRFKSLIDKTDFWNLGKLDQPANAGTENPGQHNDTRWILEGAIHDKAHAADRGSDVEGAFREAALLLLEKSRLDPNGPTY